MQDRISRPRRSTIKDVAREAGVSIAAVSYAINGSGTLSDEARDRIRLVAKRLGYHANKSAQTVRTGRSTTLGLLVPDLNNPYYPALAQSVERAARQAGYTVLLIDTAGDASEEVPGIRLLESQGVAGAIWFQTATTAERPPTAFSMPVVVIGTPGLEFDNVATKDFEGGGLIASHLLAMGHRRFGLLPAANVAVSKDGRREGFLNAVGRAGEVVWELKSPFSIDLPASIVERLTQRDVTAVMCGNDLIAIGVIRAARQLGMSVPGDLSVVGFDDIPWASIVDPPLTTVRQPVAEMAAVAITLLLDRIAEPDRAVRHFRVDVELVIRQSVRNLAHTPIEGSQ
jgi:LacI family transcriptional regulator